MKPVCMVGFESSSFHRHQQVIGDIAVSFPDLGSAPNQLRGPEGPGGGCSPECRRSGSYGLHPRGRSESDLGRAICGIGYAA